uniref:Polyketide synthase-nonribosomal peptide synthase n=1 Tax=Alternaria oxytropis TaxID=570715 RepID=A0A4P8L802_9PLEO|nr:polyketide synthase-nonribosomal peptide synthase [Alternaria oxytropis]
MSEPVAIIGSACRLPGGADSPAKLWELLKNPSDVLSDMPADRLNLWSFYHQNGEYHGSTDVPNKGYLLSEDIRLFDAAFFRINPQEADGMDPQQRLVLETVYEALESAACPLEHIQNSMTSVYAGLMNHDYGDIQARDIETIPTHSGIGTHQAILSNRISYFLDIKGASMTIDTACSSSLVALHQAMHSLRSGESDMAIVVGANLLLDTTSYVSEAKLHMLSPTSRSRMWDASADGYARGEGFAAIVLKTLDRATAHADDVECIIRATAVNQDGRTAGITAPSAAAQTALIKRAYHDAGLDPVADRCQFFEAHGTGTRAGDPVEARGIRDAFFPQDHIDAAPPGNLLVGSIKTVVGHLEGCAGLAGLLKASLAMQNRTIPPNMHFCELNPAIGSLYDNLKIPTQACAWPDVPAGTPLRASVNSFGFGGTNAHVILETPPRAEQEEQQQHDDEERFVGPLLLSANSQTSLVRTVEAYADYIRSNKQLDLADLTWTLQFRRTQFNANRTFFSGATRQKLLAYMDTFVTENNTASNTTSTASANEGDPYASLGEDGPATLGIFTGQGAQWPSMGRNLILHSPLFRQSIRRCEDALMDLENDAPSWSLEEELLAEGEHSRVALAAIAQPLSLACQIGLVDLLHASGIKWQCVVGHSSGETAAAYAAGMITAKDAIRIAYYRGLHSHLAQGPQGQDGGMLAVGLSFDSATALCNRSEYKGRIVVAASNSPTSVTISGDIDAIDEVKAHLDEERTFARKLNVDKAYHSHHMKPCADAYLNSLKSCNIQVSKPRDGCVWVSSVRGDADMVLEEDESASLQALSGQYWVDNLLRPVLFAPAVECALWKAGPFDVAAEVGVHPALKGPATQIFKASLGSSLPYFSVMRRGDDEVEAFSGGLGYLWEHFGVAACIDFDGHRRAFTDSGGNARSPRLVKGLPSYQWDHTRVHWKESRISHAFRLHDRPLQEMLGRRAIDDTAQILRWRNILRPTEMPWVKDHVFQGQIILPGASYVAAIIEAVKVVAGQRPIKLIELADVKIPKAIVLQDNRLTELMTTLAVVRENDQSFSANFSFFTALADVATSVPEKTCSGRVVVEMGEPNSDDEALCLPEKQPSNLRHVDLDMFYANLKNLGVNYQGLFRATRSMQRTLGFASSVASWEGAELGDLYSLHPTILDVAFHAVLAAFASPSSGQMWSMYLPIGMRKITIHLDSLPGRRIADVEAQIQAIVTASSAKGLEGDVQVMFGSKLAVQVEGAELQATGDAKISSDRILFSSTHWDTDISSGIVNVVLEKQPDPEADEVLLEAMGRTALYYYRSMLEDISPREAKTLPWHLQMFWQSAQHWVEEVRTGRHASVKSEWLDDSRETVWKHVQKCQNSIDIVMMRALGEKMPSIMRGDTQPLEVMMENDMLTRFYAEAHALDGMNDHIARALGQITHRYPHAHILEIGAGVGGTTRKILRAIGNSFGHYTFTDISSGFFEKGAKRFSEYARRMTFKVCDIEKDPIDEGFVEGAYDVIVAANVLHATRNLADTMRHVRRLLKPGGYLVMMEITGDLLRLGYLMGALPGWWLGPRDGDEGRQWAPGIDPIEWDNLLHRTGFSGVDHIVSDASVTHKHYVSTIVSQATDEKFNLLQNPLSNLSQLPSSPEKLVILGGRTLPIARLVRELQKLLAPWNNSITLAADVEQLSLAPEEQVSVISLTELDQPLFANTMTASRLKSLQNLLSASRSILWATAGTRGSDPTANIFTGIARALRTERQDIGLQLLDFEKPSNAKAADIAEHFLRLQLSNRQEYTEYTMLWTTEHELALSADMLMIPRVKPERPLNERYCAARRNIIKEVTLSNSDIEIESNKGQITLEGVDANLSRRLLRPTASNQFILDVYASVALCRHDSGLFLCYGSCRDSDHKVYAISRTNRSVVLCSCEDSLVLETPPPEDQEGQALEAVASHLIARSLVSSLPRRGAVLIYRPPSESFVAAIESSDQWKGRQVHYATSNSSISVPSSWISLSRRTLTTVNAQKIPSDVTSVIDWSQPDDLDIRSLVSAGCVIRKFEPSLVATGGQEIRNALSDALTSLQYSKQSAHKRIPVNTLHGVSSRAIDYPNIVEWGHERDEPVTVQVQTLKPAGIFSGSTTHFMVGLSGELGQSICAYMVRNGARHIAIASRRGEVDPEWLAHMQRDYKADIRLYKMDVTSEQSIRVTLDRLQVEMPPIGGVSNGAMVLNDKAFLDMDVESLNATLRPKVTGSGYLDKFFSTGNLDYFVLFSSAAAIGNNGGQSNYNAANLFMTSLVANRRSRGLAASVIHVGVVVDIGYVARQDRKLPEHLRKQGYMLTSESDAHFLFAEGVLASPADSQLCAEILMGLELFRDHPDATSRPPWYNDARLSHLIVEPEDDAADAKEGHDDVLHIRGRLDQVKSPQEGHNLVQEAFSAKLEVLMQLDAGGVNAHIPLLDMGFDSLLAVETRTWFWQELHVDVPVLRFLEGDTVHQISEEIVTQYLANRSKEESQEKKEENVPHENNNSLALLTTSSDDDLSSSSPRSGSSLNERLASEIPSVSQSEDSCSVDGTDKQVKVDRAETEAMKPKEIIQTGITAKKSPTKDMIRVDRMSFAQSRLWFLGEYLDDPTTSNIVVSYIVRGPLDVSRLENAITAVAAHHPSLRTCFFVDEETGEPMQGILRASNALVSSRTTHASSREEIQAAFDNMRNHEWDLVEGITFGATLLATENYHEYALIFGYHHIVIDGVSWAIILQDIQHAYNMQPLSRQKQSYADASNRQKQLFESQELEPNIQFWTKLHANLPDMLPLLPFASTHRRQLLRRYESQTITKVMSNHLVQKIKDASTLLRVTPLSFYLAAVQVLFSHLIDSKDLCIGVTDASRYGAEVANTVGFFVNILPLRFTLDSQDSFPDLIRKTFRHVLEGQSNGQVPVDIILDRLKVPREASSSPLFQLVFNYRVGAVAEMTLGSKCQLSADSYRDAEVPFDIGFGVYEVGDGSQGLQIIAQKYLYDEAAAQFLMSKYYNLLEMLASDTSQTIAEYRTRSDDSALIQAGIMAGKGPRQVWDWPDTLSKRVDTMIKEHRGDMAIIDSKASMTYGELDDVIRLAASFIQAKRLSIGSVIAVLCQPSSDLVVALLAIMRLGLVYLPLDTNIPKERHAAILEDCTPALVLYHDDTAEMASKISAQFACVNLSLILSNNGTSITKMNQNLSRADGPAILLYTSGSTGKPKGIQLNNAGYLNHLALKTSLLSLQREVVLQQSSFGFDMSLTQVFCALANGGSLVIVPKKSRGDPVALSKLMLEHGVTFTIATPSEYSSLLRYGQTSLQNCRAWKHACMGGEVVTQQLFQSFSELNIPNLKLTNCYGPTETSLAVTFERLSEHSKRSDGDYGSVGKVLPNYSVYIVDEVSSQLVPLGFPGEICIGGAGVAIGYLNLPELSSAKFIRDPFVTVEDAGREWLTMFKTGDRGRLRPDGSLVFMGRTDGDNMIKLRGVRIDLEDVASNLVHTAGDVVAEAVVTVHGEDEARMLVAHVVLREDASKSITLDSLQEMAQNLPLPAYMRPALVVPREHLPRTSNGKVDRKSLTSMELPMLENQSSTRHGGKMSLEVGELSLLWTEVLHQHMFGNLSPESDFFMVGGSSLLLVQLQGIIKENMGIAIPIADLYQASTLGRMAARLQAQKTQQEPFEEIDWKQETEFQASSELHKPLPEAIGPVREVLLTGAHAFHGAEILRVLVKDSSIKRIHCVAIPKTAMKSIAHGHKVIFYPGLLQADSLGLSSDDLKYLQPRIDAIIHAGSVGHCLNNYSSLRIPNLGSLRFLVQFALPRRIPIHFISSNRVALLSGRNVVPLLSVSSHPPPTDGSEGFTASKWAGEHLIESVAQQTGLRATIHRPCAIIGPNAPREDALNALLRFSIALKAVPRFANLAGFLDFAPAESVATSIAQLATCSPRHDTTNTNSTIHSARIPHAPSCVIVHHSSGVRTPFSEFGSRMQTLYGSAFAELDMQSWIEEAVKQGMDPLISSYLEALVEKGSVIEFPYLGVDVESE